jgi:abortive infection bacteriophage resistance protein
MIIKNFNKPSLDISQQLALLSSRGLIITNKLQAAHWLEYIGYYRLSGYWRYFYQDPIIATHAFKSETNFETLIEHYEFDRNLRILVLDGVERIEVAIRAAISNVLCQKYGGHWFLERNNFKNNFNFDEFIKKIKIETNYEERGGNNPIFKSYYKKYQFPELPPSWMLAEGLTFGTWSKIYAFLASDKDKKEIAKKFALPWAVFQSWIHCICFVRNLCAHHAILGFRKFHIEPLKPKNWQAREQAYFKNYHSLYVQLVLVQHFLKIISPDNDWADRLKTLLLKYKDLPYQEMGFINNWDQEPFWLERKLK